MFIDFGTDNFQYLPFDAVNSLAVVNNVGVLWTQGGSATYPHTSAKDEMEAVNVHPTINLYGEPWCIDLKSETSWWPASDISPHEVVSLHPGRAAALKKNVYHCQYLPCEAVKGLLCTTQEGSAW